ncbi:MAG: redoxin domain-containing protein [Patescibacteria group bacterium]
MENKKQGDSAFSCEVKVGHAIPDFEREIYHEDAIKKVKLSDYRGKWLVLFFYPADFTFVCPTELEEMALLYEEFKKINAEVVSVSTDTVYAHKAWHDMSPAVRKIAFPMLADPTGRLCQAFGTYIDDEGLALRGSFIVDPEGVVRALEVNDNSIGRSAKELFRKLQAAQYVEKHDGQVCPASWEPGKEALTPGLEKVGKI